MQFWWFNFRSNKFVTCRWWFVEQCTTGDSHTFLVSFVTCYDFDEFHFGVFKGLMYFMFEESDSKLRFYHLIE